jgi:hypothetical protein
MAVPSAVPAVDTPMRGCDPMTAAAREMTAAAREMTAAAGELFVIGTPGGGEYGA